MRLAVLSGKGGTGKTFISVNLASVAKEAIYLDCDVEEPNGRIFLKPELGKKQPISVPYPQVDQGRCHGCKECVEFCKFSALSYVGEKLLVFPQMCHSCGGCVLLCPQKALVETEREIGSIEYGRAGELETRGGILKLGEPSGVPIIEKIIESIPVGKTAIVDCPPGSSCTVMESIRQSDYCLLVTEPTAFGIHNLALVLELVRLMNKPHGVLINKGLPGETMARDYCIREGLTILETIPYDSELAYTISQGQLAVEKPKYRQLFEGLLGRIEKEAGL